MCHGKQCRYTGVRPTDVAPGGSALRVGVPRAESPLVPKVVDIETGRLCEYVAQLVDGQEAESARITKPPK